MEYDIGFLPTQFGNPERLYIEMLGITYPNASYRIDRPDSHVYCIEYVISGTGWVSCDGSDFRPRAGDAFVMPAHAHQRFGASLDDPFNTIWINCSGTLCDALYDQYGLRRAVHYPGSQRLYPVMQAFLSLCDVNWDNPEYIAERGGLAIHEIFALLAEPAPRPMSREARFALTAKNFIDSHAAERLTTIDIAAATGISVSHLNRCFAGTYATTPHRYYTAGRMRLACALLANTNLDVAQIAKRLHFADGNNFSTAFKKEMGASPSDYRHGGAGTR